MSFRSAALEFVHAVDRVVPKREGITVLIYHRVGAGSQSSVDTEVEDFRAQLRHLAEFHDVISLTDAVRRLSAEPGLNEPGLVITFDDGTADFVDHAVPALIEAELPATLYACTQSIDEQQPFPWGAPPASWSGLREAASTGLISIESHTHSHALLDRLPAAEVAAELDRSIELISEHVGAVPRHFAYPKAVPGSTAAEAAVRERFDSAALARNRVNRMGRSDVHRLWRTPIQRGDDLARFAAKAAGGARVEGELRHQSARWKYRGAVR